MTITTHVVFLFFCVPLNTIQIYKHYLNLQLSFKKKLIKNEI